MAFETMPHASADVIVIGGGIVGVSAAYWLARAGVRVTLLERSALAASATGRNGGFLTVGAAEPYPVAVRRWGHETAKAIWQLTYNNRDLLREVIATEGIACDYREPGCLHLALNESELLDSRDAATLLNADGFAHEVLDRQQAQACVGVAMSNDMSGALLLPRGGLLHSAKLVIGLATAAQRMGAKVCQADVTQVTQPNSRVRVMSTRGAMEARSVIASSYSFKSACPLHRGLWITLSSFWQRPVALASSEFRPPRSAVSGHP